ncbi:putative kinase [Halorubrum alkaliphilum]|uniref:Putative kinase n=1 Tax=Halorubrum alkaliphilum TaxID=261290 RepID=A0A8T4GAK5_9EURY|nr:AAA family ATPase [Halorubrum alkaliphilum]MBP1921468.1 putative kinase [Halorubrum alkaliphilum]
MADREATDAPEQSTTEATAGTTEASPPPTTTAASDAVDPSASDAVDPSASNPAGAETVAAGVLVVVCGLPGVGKTTVARRVADHVDGRVLRTDVIRKELFPDPTYSDEETAAVYEELVARARDRVTAGDAVVLDATFADERFRRDVRRMASEAADGFELVKVECEESIVKRRIERRDGISDADFDIHLRFKELFDGIDTDHLVVDNSGEEAATFDQVDAAFDGAGDGFDRAGDASE